MAKVAEALKKIASEVLKEYDGLIKAIWIYGSAVRKGEFKPTSDIDMMILLDDVSQKVTSAKLAEVDKTVTKLNREIKKKLSVNIHPQPPKRLSDWWDLLRSGEPWVFTSMRDAVPIYDPSGYIEPIQRLLRNGRLHGTWERAQMLLARAPRRIERVRRIFLKEIMDDLLSAMVESAQAALMFAGAPPAAASTLGAELRKRFVKPGLLEEGYVELYEDFFELVKKIEHGEVTKVSGKELDRWIARAKAFIVKMQKLFDRLEEQKKRQLIEEAHKESLEAVKEALARVGKPIRDEKEIIKLFEEHLIKTGLVSKSYLDILRKIFSLKKALEQGKLEEVSERDVYSSRLYARNLKLILEILKRGAYGKGRTH